MKFPEIRLGFILGPYREESYPSKKDVYEDNYKWLFMTNEKPEEREGETWVITHLQKKSKFGFLLTKPFGFHFWWMWKLQEIDKPGSERGLYFRLPGYRWDVDLGMIRTNGYFGFHWD